MPRNNDYHLEFTAQLSEATALSLQQVNTKDVFKGSPREHELRDLDVDNETTTHAQRVQYVLFQLWEQLVHGVSQTPDDVLVNGTTEKLLHDAAMRRIQGLLRGEQPDPAPKSTDKE